MPQYVFLTLLLATLPSWPCPAGKALIGQLTAQLGLCCWVQREDLRTLAEVLAQGPEHACCQLLTTQADSCRAHLACELQTMKALCSAAPVLPSGKPDPRSWDGYTLVRAAAQEVGARAGPVAMAVFSCTGRGRTIFDAKSMDNEACMTDDVSADVVVLFALAFVSPSSHGE